GATEVWQSVPQFDLNFAYFSMPWPMAFLLLRKYTSVIFPPGNAVNSKYRPVFEEYLNKLPANNFFDK
ncbi:MAG: hypothetical protein ABI813_07090, partial [Bacteroidota bacterium]